MTHRGSATLYIQSTRLGAVLVIGVLALSARPAVGQVTTKLVTTERMGLGAAGAMVVSHDSERPVELVLLAHRIEDDRVVDTHRSSPFEVAADRPYRLDERHLPAQRFYSGTLTGEVVTTRDAVSLESVERVLDGTGDGFWSNSQEWRDTGAWSNVRSFQEWKPRDGVVFVALPADDRLRRDAKAYPMLVFVEGASR